MSSIGIRCFNCGHTYYKQQQQDRKTTAQDRPVLSMCYKCKPPEYHKYHQNNRSLIEVPEAIVLPVSIRDNN